MFSEFVVALEVYERYLEPAQPADFPGEIEDILDPEPLDDVGRGDSLDDRSGEIVIGLGVFAAQKRRLPP
jgi:hypothetical protein